MGIVFYEGQPNFPADIKELKERLATIAKLINNDDSVTEVNIKFVEAAFQLMQDCEMLTEKNLRFLCNAVTCRNFNKSFRFPFNPFEGVLRAVTDDENVFGGKDNGQRFYYGTDRRVESSYGQHYLISNDWYADRSTTPNKRQFFKWLSWNATAAFRAHRDAQLNKEISSPATNPAADRRPSHIPPDTKITTKITDELSPEADNETANAPDDIKQLSESMMFMHRKINAVFVKLEDLEETLEVLELLHNKIDEINEQVETLNKNIEPLKNILKLK